MIVKVQSRDSWPRSKRLQLWQLMVLLFGVLGWKTSVCSAANNVYSFSIPENEPKGTRVGRLPKQGSHYYMIAASTPQQGMSDFAITTQDGVISTGSVLDREKVKNGMYNLTVNDLVDPMNPTILHVLVDVQDVNDNSPQFVGGSQNSVILSEGHSSFRYKIIATDLDIGFNTTQSYSIVSGNVGDVFKLVLKKENNQRQDLYADLMLNTGKVLDRETKDSYVLNISASDGGTPQRQNFLQLTITVSDLNDHPPVFSSQNYSVLIPENIKPPTSIIKVSATDKDIGSNAKIYYSIEPHSDPKNEFGIDSNGVISSYISPDFETKKQYILSVKAENTDSNVKLFSKTWVTINIQDENDNSPAVHVRFYRGGQYQVYENAKVGEEVARVSVSDLDSGKNGDVNVTLEGGDGFFSMKYDVQKSESVIYVGKSLNREVHDHFILTASCVDNGVPSKSTKDSFRINVGDVNDNYPKCDRHFYTSRVIENATVNTLVASIHATDADIGLNAKLVYSLANSTLDTVYAKWFSIDSSTGVIRTAAGLDREKVQHPLLTVVVSDKGNPSLSANCTVIVNISDTNDNDPLFNQSIYQASVLENSASTTYVLHVYARDPDLGDHSLIKYTIPSRFTIPFRIDSDSGSISTVRSIDHETSSMFSFQVIATDGGGRRALTTVNITILDKNDNSPVFQPVLYHKEVKEDVSVTSKILSVIASDRDSGVYSKLTYNITSGNADGLFAIDASSGLITLAKKLDRETKDSHVFTVNAIDGGGRVSSNVATVNITVLDVNDEPPVFEYPSYNYSIVENSEPAVVGTVKATSKDLGTNAYVTYSIIKGDIDNHFIINSTGTIYLRTQVDHEKTPQLKLTIQAKDGGKPALYGYSYVIINVTDLNDNAPQFNGSILAVFLPENTLVGTSFYQVHAVDPDSGSFGTITYTIVTNPGQHFHLHKDTGDLSLQKAFNTDGRSYTLVVKAEDGGLRSTEVTLNVSVVDVNDHAPVFLNSSYEVHVPETQSALSSILKVSAIDKDTGSNAKITYSFKSGADTSKFGVKADGWIYIKTKLDREEKELYKLTLIASDQGLPKPLTASADVTVIVDDDNDNNPVFRSSSYIFYILEGKPTGTIVDSVSASDRDKGMNGKVTYSFETPLKKFTINKDTGEIRTTTVLDREKKVSYTVIVVATDGGISSRHDKTQVTIVIRDVNDNSPVFNPSQYNEKVYENVGVGYTIVKVMATDDDEPGSPNSDVRYSIVAGQQNSRVFSMNGKTGEITVSSSLDREKKDRYILHVDAKDLGNPPNYNIAMVTINILDVNDNPPQFLNMTDFVNVPEKLAVGSNVTRVKAVDHDDGDNGRIEYEIVRGNSGYTFTIDKTTGIITTRILLDFERQNRYQLKISAKDMGQTQHITYRWVNIFILDANDNRPTFEKNPIIASVYEGVPINHTVKTIQARDDDSGSNSWIWYSIDSQNPEAHFKIDPMSGAVQTISKIDREAISEFTLIVRATDQAYTQKDRLFSTATLKIIVLDVNDNKPVFVSRNITYIMEDEPFNFEVMSVTAIDHDTDSSGKVEYRIVGGDTGKFTLDPRTGVLKKIGTLDFETKRTHILNISATDEGSPSLSSFQRLTIVVVDVNDNPPEFTQKLFAGSVSEGEPVGTSVLRATAHDLDSGTNAEFTYSFPSGAEREKFRINSTSGWITTNATLDREEQSSYTFVVYATGNTYPFRVSTTNVRVDVLDKNDNAPKFASSTVTTKIVENSSPRVFYTAVAEDFDDGRNANVEYRILSGNTDSAFNISTYTGELENAKKLDREDIAEYTLTIEAKDTVKPFYTDTCNVTVIVQDANDNRPRFLKSKYSKVISEVTTIGKPVLNVTAEDKDAGTNARIVYTLSNDTHGYFRVDTQTGVITTESRFDTSVKSEFKFHCFAHDQGSVPKMDVALITVTIEDMNTHTPVFSKTPYQANVFQNSSAGSTVVTVTATDADTNKATNGKVSYRIKTASPSSLFVLDSNTGILKTSQSFNNPLSGRHILYIKAQDHGQPPKSSDGIIEVLIGTVQDDPPVFVNSSQSTVIIPENAPTNGYVTTLIARNNNRNPVSYNIISGNRGNAFSINPNTGVLTVQATATLDYETIKVYELQLVATLKTGVSLNGYMTLNVRLTDVNDNNPVFHPSNLVTQLPEDPEGGAFVSRAVVMVTATDADSTSNAQISYSIESGNFDDIFAIDSTTGQIRTAKSLDRERVPSYHLVVKATDKGSSPRFKTCKVEVIVTDVNDNTPVFNVTKEISVPEDTRPGSVIAMATATDADQDNQLTYTLKSQSVAHMFVVSRFTSAVTLLGTLDFETQKMYSVVVRVSDGKHHNDVTITVHVTDVNDNSPTFLNSSYHLKITQPVRAGVPLLRVTATDKDSGLNSKVRYSFLQPIPEFTINVTSGVVSTQKRIEVGIRDALNQILVVATDRGSPPQRSFVYVRILITGEPQFDRAQYTASVPEDVTVGSSIVTVKTTQNPPTTPSARVSFVIESGDLRNQFRIGQRSGVVRVNSPLDYETTKQYQLVVRAFDDIAPSNLVRVTILINVTDVNDMKPVFRKSRYISQWEENVAIGTIVMNVSATDRDSGTNAKVWYAIQSGDDVNSFAIDRYTGVIRTVKELDHDSTKNHHLSVRATDQGTPDLHSEVSVTIQVLDLNDNAPVFHIPNPGQVRVPENSPISTVFFNLTATDRDSDANGRMTYTITGGEGEGLFLINPLSGILRTNAVFDYETKSTYSLDVNVKDAGSPPLQSNISIIISIGSVDEYSPTFLDKSYAFKVPGNAEVDDFVGQVSATDEDGGEDGEVFYSFVDPTSDALKINTTSGAITVNRTLNDGSELHEKRERRSIDFLGDTSSIGSAVRTRTRREADENQIHMTVQADSGKPNSNKVTSFVYVTVDYTCPGCGIVTKGQQTGGGGISGTSLVIIIALAVLAGVILLVLIVVMLLIYGHKKREKTRNKNPRLQFDGSFDEITVHPPTGTSNHGAVSNESLPAPRPYPQEYTPLTRTTDNSNNVTSTEASEETPGSASSGRGSSDGDFEESPPAYVNGDIGSLHSDNYVKTIIADSGIQENEDDRISQLTISDGSGILHVDDCKPYKNDKVLSRMDFQSQESIHVFGEEGGGEADGGHDVGNLLYAKLAEADADDESIPELPRRYINEGRDRGPYAGSLSSIIGSKEELTGSYNWDYLLDWGPQFHPLAEVFLEIGRMKDEDDIKNLHGRNGIRSIPSSRIPSHLPGIATTDMLSSISSLPRSPVSPPSTQYTSPAFSPNFTPAITPLITRSPSVSPLDTGTTSPSFSPQGSRPASTHVQLVRTRTDSQGDTNSELSHSPSISDNESNLEIEI